MLFRDVVSNIALGRQDKNVLAFYIRRLGQEKASRIITAVLAVALVTFQAVTFLVPPKPSEASAGSGNDIVYGGFSSKAELLRKYDSNPELRAIFGRVRIYREQIANMSYGRVNSAWNVWSMGRYQHGDNNIRLDVPGAHTAIWLRPLRVWGNNKWFSGLQGVNADGARTWILTDCGNPVIEVTQNTGQKEVPPQPTLPPPPSPTTPPPPPPVPGPIEYRCDTLQAYPDPNNPDLKPPLTVSFVTTATVKNTALKSYIYDFGDGTTKESTEAKLDHTYKEAGTYTAKVRVVTSSGSTSFTTSCQQRIEVKNPQLAYLKQAVNLSLKDDQNRPTNAAGTTVKAGNEIRYSLAVTNSGNGTAKGFRFEENVGDILEYAELTDNGGATLTAESVPGQDKLVQKRLVWDPVDIKAGETVTKQFIVKVKNPIPTTPTGLSDKNSYDLKMENIFFNQRIEILLPPPPVKTVELVSQSLPQTGASAANTGLALFASGAVFIYLRQRLLQKELAILATQGDHRA